jgi:hypothetical protein
MKMSPKSALVLLTLLCGTASLGQDSPTPPRAPAPAPPAAEAEAEPESPPPAERPEVNDDEFIPTEELAPDAAITFPVDI